VNANHNFHKIIINADDFGMSTDANKAIIEAFARGVISSTTLMANMPAFEEACELAHRNGLIGKIGVHLNLTAGLPLTESIRDCGRFCGHDGTFQPRKTKIWLSQEEVDAAMAELDAQVEACLYHGIHPTHLDSHHHMHTEWGIGKIVIAVARRHGIGAIRLSRNCGTGIGLARRLYKYAYNARLRLAGLAKTQYFGSISDVEHLLETATGGIEVMVHLTTEDPAANADCCEQIGLLRCHSTYEFASYLS